MHYFRYGATEIAHLQQRDPLLGAAITAIGPIRRAVDGDLFRALINFVAGQQISAKALATIWRRMLDSLGQVTPQTVQACPVEALQKTGLTFKKVGYMKGIAQQVSSGAVDLAALPALSDAEICATLTALPGVGQWTAEMLLLFSLQRPDVLSYGDLAIQRGIKRLYGLERLDKAAFAHYKELYSPYGSTASLYLWAIAGGA